jgi:hypothetical protein
MGPVEARRTWLPARFFPWVGAAEVAARKVTATLSGATFELHLDERRRLLRWWQQRGDIEVTLRQPRAGWAWLWRAVHRR